MRWQRRSEVRSLTTDHRPPIPMPQTRIIIQARTDSTRLPAKALLPVAGMPSALLALSRAGNTGLNVRLATSERDIDDRLAGVVEAAGGDVFRGSADNVRQRFLNACSDLNDEAAIVRLTADNLLPDGHLIDEVLTEFSSRQCPYLNLEMIWHQPPYGLSVEVFQLGALRAAAEQIDSEAEREHVTPALRASHEQTAKPEKRFSPQESAIRCTMDTFDDYLWIANCFDDLEDPVNTPWQALIERLVNHPDAPQPFAPGPGLVLGTAQIAAPYGSAVTVNPPARAEAIVMLRKAIGSGASGIDTARAYPGSEPAIGKALKAGYAGRCDIITKLAPLDDLPADAGAKMAADAAEISLLRSLNALGGECRPDVLLHRAAHLKQWDSAVWKRLQALQSEGLTGRIGVSVQSPQELEQALATPSVSLVQMPCNLLDWRWRQAGLIERLEQANDLTVHVRSVLLQGTLARPAAEWPMIEGFNPQDIIDFLKRQTENLERQSIADLCIAWMRAQPWVGALVIGAETSEQLDDTLNLFARPPLELAQATTLTKEAPLVPEQLLDPAKWK